MAESEFQEGNDDGRWKDEGDGKRRENFKKSTEELLDKMENLTVWATQIIYECTAIRTNPDLTNTLQHLEDAFLRCKERMEKKGQEVLIESRGEGQKKE